MQDYLSISQGKQGEFTIVKFQIETLELLYKQVPCDMSF